MNFFYKNMNVQKAPNVYDWNVSFHFFKQSKTWRIFLKNSWHQCLLAIPPISASHWQAILTTRILVTFIWAIVVSIALLFKWNANSTSNAFKLRDLWFCCVFCGCSVCFHDRLMIYLLRCERIRNSPRHRHPDSLSNHHRPPVGEGMNQTCKYTHRLCMLF